MIWRNCKVIAIEMRPRACKDGRFQECKIGDSVFGGAMEELSIIGCTLQDVKVEAPLEQLVECTMDGGLFSHVNLSKTKLRNTTFKGTQFLGVSFGPSSLEAARFERATFDDGCSFAIDKRHKKDAHIWKESPEFVDVEVISKRLRNSLERAGARFVKGGKRDRRK